MFFSPSISNGWISFLCVTYSTITSLQSLILREELRENAQCLCNASHQDHTKRLYPLFTMWEKCACDCVSYICVCICCLYTMPDIAFWCSPDLATLDLMQAYYMSNHLKTDNNPSMCSLRNKTPFQWMWLKKKIPFRV